MILDNLHRIVFRIKGGKLVPFLDGEDCHIQINSLVAKGVVAFAGRGRPVKAADPDGVLSRCGARRPGGPPAGPAPLSASPP